MLSLLELFDIQIIKEYNLFFRFLLDVRLLNS